MKVEEPIDYCVLLTGRTSDLSDAQWKEILNAAVYGVGAGDDADAAFHALESVLPASTRALSMVASGLPWAPDGVLIYPSQKRSAVNCGV